MSIELKITIQQATELEMLLQSVKDFGVKVEGVELGVYSEAVVQLHQQIQGRLNDQLEAQQRMQKLEGLPWLEQMRALRDQWWEK